MGLIDNFLVKNAYLGNHRQAKILDDVAGQSVIAYLVTIDIKARVLPLTPPPLEKIDFKIEANSLFTHSHSCRCYRSRMRHARASRRVSRVYADIRAIEGQRNGNLPGTPMLDTMSAGAVGVH